MCPNALLPPAPASKDEGGAGGEAETEAEEDTKGEGCPVVRECFQMVEGFGGGASKFQMTPSDHCPVGLTLKI